MPDDAKRGIRENGFEIIELPPSPALQTQVASHPDMLIYFGEKLITSEGYYAVAKLEIDKISRISGKAVEFASEVIKPDYPFDVRFNAFEVGRCLFCSEKGVSGAVTDDAKRRGLDIVYVKQGYAKCSTVVVGENAIITADVGIANAARARGVYTLVVSSGGVTLDGYDHGFLGGASGAFGNKVYFCGDLERHPDCAKIVEFCEKHGKKVVSLSPSPLFDAGTIFFI